MKHKNVKFKITNKREYEEITGFLINKNDAYFDHYIGWMSLVTRYYKKTNNLIERITEEEYLKLDLPVFSIPEEYKVGDTVVLYSGAEAVITEVREESNNPIYCIDKKSPQSSNNSGIISTKTLFRPLYKIEYPPQKNEEMITSKCPLPSRFPFVLELEQAREIINIACCSWKSKLAYAWGQELLLHGSVSITEAYYKEMRKACTDEQHKLFDTIFGKDEPEIITGTPIWGRFSKRDLWCYGKFARFEGENIIIIDSENKPYEYKHYSLTPPEL